jgi:hypothetical protein
MKKMRLNLNLPRMSKSKREQFICPPPCPCARQRRAGPLGAALRPNECGFALVWWALFIGLAAFPLLVFVVEGSRYLKAAGAVQKAADAAAEAAVREIDVPHYVETGEIRFSGNEYFLAEQYANANAEFLHVRQIAIQIQAIAVDEAQDTVRVTALADVSALFPAIAPSIIIRREGTAQVRLTAR